MKQQCFSPLPFWITQAVVNMILQRFSRVNLTCAKDIVFSFRLSVILHQKHPAHSHKEVQANASVRAAFVHALGDLFQSISVLTRALIIYFKVSMSESTPCSSDFID